MPTDPTQRVRGYSSPPRREGSWVADRPGDLEAGQPTGTRLGWPGPDQGYALKLATLFVDRLHLGAVAYDDAVAGCTPVATKRAAIYGRAPIIHDLTIAFAIFGFLDQDPPQELVSLREAIFAELHSHHHYRERRAVVDMVSEAVLRQPEERIRAEYDVDWKRNLNV